MTKTNYTITEKQNLQSERKGETVACETLRGARMAAGKRQNFQGTVMTIDDEQGRLVAYKKNGKWCDDVEEQTGVWF